jgi:hypothetical protein
MRGRKVTLYSRASGQETGETTAENLAASLIAQNVLSPRIVIAFDLSLRRPGWCALSPDWDPRDPWKRIEAEAYEPGKVAGAKRLDMIVSAAACFSNVAWNRTNLSVPPAFGVEQHAFGMSRGAYALERAELVGALKVMVYRRWGVEVLPVVASSARKLIFGPTKKTQTGGKNGWKRFIEARFVDMGAPTLWGEDERDAIVIGNALLHHMGRPCLAS